MLVVNATDHTYTWNGERRPSVTDLLTFAGYGSNLPRTPAADAARAFGNHVHDVTALHDRRCAYVPRYRDLDILDVYKRFLREHRPAFTAIEEPRYSRRLGIAGTPDRDGWMSGEPFVLDLKTGHPDRFHGVQLAGYDLLHPLPRGRRRRRFVLYLTAVDYALRECTTVTDYNEFLSIREAYFDHHR